MSINIKNKYIKQLEKRKLFEYELIVPEDEDGSTYIQILDCQTNQILTFSCHIEVGLFSSISNQNNLGQLFLYDDYDYTIYYVNIENRDIFIYDYYQDRYVHIDNEEHNFDYEQSCFFSEFKIYSKFELTFKEIGNNK